MNSASISTANCRASAILDKGQQSVKEMNSGSEGFVTVDLILTVQKPEQGDLAEGAASLANGHAESLIEQAINELSAKDAGNASYVYTRVLAKAIQSIWCWTIST